MEEWLRVNSFRRCRRRRQTRSDENEVESYFLFPANRWEWVRCLARVRREWQSTVRVCVSRFFSRAIFSIDLLSGEWRHTSRLSQRKKTASCWWKRVCLRGENSAIDTREKFSFDLSSVGIQEILTGKNRPDYQWHSIRVTFEPKIRRIQFPVENNAESIDEMLTRTI